MTIHELSQLYYMNKDIQRLVDIRAEKTEQLEELISRSTGISGMNMNGMPRASTPRNRIEDIIAQIDAKEREILVLDQKIRKKRIRYEAVKQELEEAIDRCGDWRIALILKYRFVDLLTWPQIANRIGGKNTADGVRKACDRYIREKLS